MKKKQITKRLSVLASAVLAAASVLGVSVQASAAETQDISSESLSTVDMSRWLYNEEEDVYYQLEIPYCAAPVNTAYETLAIFVPGAYMQAQDNGDGTFSCEVNSDGAVGAFTAATAPIVVPVNTPGYSAMSALTEYTSVADYTSRGLIYAHAGCRGRDDGAPAGVTDLKAGIRYLRYNAEKLPGDTDRIFSFGMSGGGAQSALLGSTGDSELYLPYLEAIGAVMDTSDAVAGSMCWCPITNLDLADEAYEWNLGVTRTGLDEETQTLSDGLAEAFAEYINTAGFVDENGSKLVLEESDTGIYQAGSYYDYIRQVIEESLNHFLEDTQFPYDASSGGGMGGGFGGGHGGQRPEGMEGGFPGGDGQMPEDMQGGFPGGEGRMPEEMQDDAQGDDGQIPEDVQTDAEAMPAADAENTSEASGEETDFTAIDNINRTSDAEASVSISGTYETPQDYIDALNANGEWVIYDAEQNTASVSSVEAFVKALKPASKSVGAFDDLNRSQGENTLFGYGDGAGAHFDSIEAALLEGTSWQQDYADDLSREDAFGNTVDLRLNMYTPLYYLMESYDGYQTAQIAPFWRIRTGIEQGDTALCTEVNLALALEQYEGVEDVDFETVWGLGHTMAERTGSSTENFISWVESCLGSASN